MKRLVMLGTLLVLALGCVACEDEWDYSEVLYENATVVAMAHTPKGHGVEGSSIKPSTHVKLDARWAVTLECAHGGYVINGRSAEKLFREVSMDDAVCVNYRLKYYRPCDGRNCDWSAVAVDFIRATPGVCS